MGRKKKQVDQSNHPKPKFSSITIVRDRGWFCPVILHHEGDKLVGKEIGQADQKYMVLGSIAAFINEQMKALERSKSKTVVADLQFIPEQEEFFSED